MDTVIQDFSSCEIGEKLWSIQLGDCEVIAKTTEYIRLKKKDNEFITTTYLLSGQLYCRDLIPSLYWAEPKITLSIAKRKVKKEHKSYAIYDEQEKNIDGALWVTKETASNVMNVLIDNYKRTNFQVIEVTASYEVME